MFVCIRCCVKVDPDTLRAMDRSGMSGFFVATASFFSSRFMRLRLFRKGQEGSGAHQLSMITYDGVNYHVGDTLQKYADVRWKGN